MNRNTPAAPSCTAVSAARLSLSPKRMPSVLVVSFSLMIGTTPASRHAAIVSRISDQRCCSRKSRWPATQEGLCTSCKLGIHPAVAGDSRALQILPQGQSTGNTSKSCAGSQVAHQQLRNLEPYGFEELRIPSARTCLGFALLSF